MDVITVKAPIRVLIVQLDTGRQVLSDRAGLIGLDRPLPAVLSWGGISAEGASLTLERAALPSWVAADWWINRPAEIRECDATSGAAAVGTLLFAGVIGAQPAESAGVLSVSLVPPRRRVRPVPDLGIVTTADWPDAAESAIGAALAEIFGTVESCPLLPVALPPATTLAADAEPDDGQLEVEDAAAFPATGTVWVDGHAYTYSAVHERVLLGVAVAAAHRQGTAVVLAGTTTFKAAGHAVSAIETLRADGRPLEGATIDLAAATVAFTEPPTLVERAERFTLLEHFDSIASGTTALNAVNAIRAITSTPSQTATALPSGVTAATSGAAIQFARPSGGRIVSGAYSVSFSVSVGSQVGWARLRIGPELAWFFEPPGPALYSVNPVAFLLADDIDAIPVTVEVAEGGSLDQVSVTITAATRVVGVGNLDDAAFATLRTASNLAWKAEQSSPAVDRGRIVKASLWVRWFASGAAALPATTVAFDGHALGTLSQTTLGNSTLSQTVSVNSVSQGAAALPQQNIGALITGGTGSLTNVPNVVRMTYPCMLYQVGSSTFYETRIGVRPPPNVASGSHVARVFFSAGSVAQQFAIYDDVVDANTPGGVFRVITGTSGGTITSSINVVTAGSAPLVLMGQFFSSTNLSADIKAMFVEVEWQILSIARNDTPASASPIAAQSLSNSGIAVSLANNAISFTVPSPPRVTDSVFPLSWVREWSDLAGIAEIVAASGGADVCLSQVAIMVEFDAEVRRRVESVSATVTGRDGNPAAVLERLAAASGQALARGAAARLSAWATAQGMALARRIAERQDALTLLSSAAEQAGVMLAETEAGLAPVRWLDLGSRLTRITEAELLAPATIGWADRVETDVTLRYRELDDGGFSRALLANAANTSACARGEAESGESIAVEIEAGWLRSDAAAALALAAQVGRCARPRRVLQLPCAFSNRVAEGELIEFIQASAAPGARILARVTGRADAGGWPTLTAEEIVR